MKNQPVMNDKINKDYKIFLSVWIKHSCDVMLYKVWRK